MTYESKELAEVATIMALQDMMRAVKALNEVAKSYPDLIAGETEDLSVVRASISNLLVVSAMRKAA